VSAVVVMVVSPGRRKHVQWTWPTTPAPAASMLAPTLKAPAHARPAQSRAGQEQHQLAQCVRRLSRRGAVKGMIIPLV
jgi:hypothetical protein